MSRMSRALFWPGGGLSRAALVGAVGALWRDLRGARNRVITAALRVRHGTLVLPPHELPDRLLDLARVPAAGQLLLLATLEANLEAHGAALLDDCASQALDRARPPEPGRSLMADLLSRWDAWERLLLALATHHERRGGIRRPLELLELLHGRRGGGVLGGGATARRIDALRSQALVLRSGLPPVEAAARSWEPAVGRVLYYANQTLPHHVSGYAIRTHWLARELRRVGWDLSVYTRLGYPNDRYDFLGARLAGREAIIDGVPYRFTPRRRPVGSISRYQEESVEALARHCAAFRPSIVHAASNYTGGLAATGLARSMGIPSVYEVRGLWHMTRGATQTSYLDSDHYRMIERLEVQAARQADYVFAITDEVAAVLEGGGVPRRKISILPNAVDMDTFATAGRDPALEERLGLRGVTTIGYVGSLHHYEGLDLLLRAAALLRRSRGDTFRVVLVGDGPAALDLRRLARALHLGATASFVGRAPHEDVARYYSLMDTMAFPRRGHRVCEVVSPIKPFEAMGAGKAIVVSGVRGLTQVVRHGETGLVHRTDDLESLAQHLERLLLSPELRLELGENARRWVAEHRTWTRVCSKVDEVYGRLLG